VLVGEGEGEGEGESGGGGGGTPEKEVGGEIETGNDGGVQTSERVAANSTSGNEESSVVLMRTTIAVEEDAGGSTQTKRLEACSCSLVARIQGAATRKGMVGEDH